MTVELTLDQTKAILSRNKSVTKWHKAFLKYFDKYDITTTERIAGFLAQCCHESGDFTIVEENLNYSASGLNRVFSKYFARAGRDATQYARQPEKIANLVYGNRMGNGGPETGDGYRFRGRGPIQLTGRDNYTRFGKTIGKTAEEAAEYMQTTDGALESALWFWKTNNLNAYCDRGDIIGMTKRINGGTNGLSDRKRHWAHALSVLGAKPPVDTQPYMGSIVKLGSTGGKVREIQVKLGLTVDGRFGPMTQAAVKKYQAKNGLTVDGIVGLNTAKRMGLATGW